MQGKFHKRPSPAFVVAMVALFVALGGTAGAVVNAAVPLAKRALLADNAKKLGGQTGAQIAAVGAKAGAAQALSQSPAGARIASSAAGLVTLKTGSGQIAAGGVQSFTIACDAGQKVLGGGFTSDQLVLGFDSYPSNDATWSLFLGNVNDGAAANVTTYASCMK
jgi:hypothetical protein